MEIIINADDFGMSKSVNRGIHKLFLENKIQRATLMMNMPGTSMAINYSRKNKYMNKIGLHINLIEGIPLTEKIRKTNICKANGEFDATFFRKLENRFFLTKKEKIAVEEEIEMQMRKYIEEGFKLMHIDSHQHSHTNLSILNIVLKLATKYKFKSMRLSRNLPLENIKGLKKFYKKYINMKISKFNNKSLKVKKYYFFGSKKDYINSRKKLNIGNYSIEVMIHPILINGVLKEHYEET